MKSDRCIRGHLWTPETTWTGLNGKRRCNVCRRQMRREAHDMGNRDRDQFGVIATLVDIDTGAEHSFHSPGLVTAALVTVCAHCDFLGDTWRVRSLSTPSTILRDIHGNRGIDKNGVVSNVPPEHNLLGRVHRRDLLAPELLAGWTDSRDF